MGRGYALTKYTTHRVGACPPGAGVVLQQHWEELGVDVLQVPAGAWLPSYIIGGNTNSVPHVELFSEC